MSQVDHFKSVKKYFLRTSASELTSQHNCTKHVYKVLNLWNVLQSESSLHKVLPSLEQNVVLQRFLVPRHAGIPDQTRWCIFSGQVEIFKH